MKPEAKYPDRIIRPKDITTITGLSRATIWRSEKKGQFPERRQISAGAVGWLWSEIEGWMKNR